MEDDQKGPYIDKKSKNDEEWTSKPVKQINDEIRTKYFRKRGLPLATQYMYDKREQVIQHKFKHLNRTILYDVSSLGRFVNKQINKIETIKYKIAKNKGTIRIVPGTVMIDGVKKSIAELVLLTKEYKRKTINEPPDDPAHEGKKLVAKYKERYMPPKVPANLDDKDSMDAWKNDLRDWQNNFPNMINKLEWGEDS